MSQMQKVFVVMLALGGILHTAAYFLACRQGETPEETAAADPGEWVMDCTVRKYVVNEDGAEAREFCAIECSQSRVYRGYASAVTVPCDLYGPDAGVVPDVRETRIRGRARMKFEAPGGAEARAHVEERWEYYGGEDAQIESITLYPYDREIEFDIGQLVTKHRAAADAKNATDQEKRERAQLERLHLKYPD